MLNVGIQRSTSHGSQHCVLVDADGAYACDHITPPTRQCASATAQICAAVFTVALSLNRISANTSNNGRQHAERPDDVIATSPPANDCNDVHALMHADAQNGSTGAAPSFCDAALRAFSILDKHRYRIRIAIGSIAHSETAHKIGGTRRYTLALFGHWRHRRERASVETCAHKSSIGQWRPQCSRD
jgi:hypothetical protein